MNSNYLKKRIGGAILGASLLLGIAIMPTMTAQAQYGYGQDSREQRRQEREARRREREQRRNDRDNRRYDDRDRDRDYRDRDRDRDYDDRDRGYNNGVWNNGRRGRNDDYANYGGSFQLRQTALNAGYNNGLEEGRKDRSRNERYDYRDEGDYQKATEDYSSRMGDRELYRRYFRDAFARGYDAGYNGY